MASRKGIKFKTRKERDASRLKLFILGFVAFLLLFGLVSVIYVFREYNISLSDVFAGSEETQSVTESNVNNEPRLSGRASFLLACSSDEKDELYFAFAVYADLDSREVRVWPLDKNSPCNVDGASSTLEEQFRRAGIRGLLGGANYLCGFEIEKYAISSESRFKNAINAVNGATIDVAERIDYKSGDFNLSLMPGEQIIKGDSLLKYLRYCGAVGGGAAQTRVMCSLLSQYISRSYVASGRSYFSELVNCVDSNITIVDYSRAAATLEAMAQPDSGISYLPVPSPEVLRTGGTEVSDGA